MKINSGVFQGWTPVLISLVFSVLTTDAAICHKPQLHWISRQNTFTMSEKGSNNFNVS